MRGSLKLEDGSHIAVIGGGPAGSFFSYFLIDMAERAGISIFVDIYEPRDYAQPGPPGCNMCAGVVSESTVQALAAEGINLPTSVVQRGIDSYVLHMDVGSARIESVRREKRIAATFRGIGPRGIEETKWNGLDSHLLKQAVVKGARHIPSRVEKVEWSTHSASSAEAMQRLHIATHDGKSGTYDLLAVTVGVNTTILKQFVELDSGYAPPRTAKCLVREYFLGEEAVANYVGDSMHTFLLNIPRLEFAALIPKGEYVTLTMIGEDIDRDLLQTFLNAPAVRECFPPNFPFEQGICQCGPRINFKGSPQPFGNRIVFVGDSGVTRLLQGRDWRCLPCRQSSGLDSNLSRDIC